jgi:hypothetical protein
MARVAHATSAALHRNQIAAISQPKDLDRNLRKEFNGSSRAPQPPDARWRGGSQQPTRGKLHHWRNGGKRTPIEPFPTVDAGARLVASPTSPVRRRLHSFADKAVKRTTDAPRKSDQPGPGRSLRSLASANLYRNPKSRKWQEITIATGFTYSICLVLSSLEGERQIGFRIGGPS